MTGSELMVAQVQKAEAMAASSILPRDYQKQPANILVAMEAAEALGVTLFQAIQMVTVINGKMTMSAEGMRALVLRAGHLLRIDAETAEECVISAARRERPDDVMVFRFGQDDAKRAGLTGGNHAKYPAAMLLARCTTKACRAVFPDVIAGISYTPEEWEQVQYPVSISAPPQSDTPAAAPVPVPVPDADRPSRADWDALEAAFTEWAAVQGIAVPLYPKQAKVISGIVGRTVTTFKQLTRADVLSVLAGLAEATAVYADTAYRAAQTDTAADIPGPEIVEGEVVE